MSEASDDLTLEEREMLEHDSEALRAADEVIDEWFQRLGITLSSQRWPDHTSKRPAP